MKQNLKKTAIYLLKSLAELLAPQICLVCEMPLGSGSSRYICQKCFDAMPIAPPPHIFREKLFRNFEAADNIFITKTACLIDLKENGSYINIIYALKYSKFPDVGREFGEYLGRILNEYDMKKYDAVLPVPVHHGRRRERGFNQAEEIAEGIRRETGIMTDFTLLKRTRYTSSQTRMKKTDRKKNVSAVFKVDAKRGTISGKSFLICDDVLTTGSTLNYSAAALLKAGAARVDAAAIAYA